MGDYRGLDAALWYAKRGYKVLPVHVVGADGVCTCGSAMCPSPGKHPRTSHGVKDATADMERIRQWWSRWPEAGVAICPTDTWLIVDIDPRNGGDRTWGRLVAELDLDVAGWPTVHTGGGGWHYYLRRPDGEQGAGTRGKLGRGIDIKGAGGYVLAPPSPHPSGESYYVWEIRPDGGPGTLPTCPDALWRRIRKPDRSRSQRQARASTRPDGTHGDASHAPPWWAVLWRRVAGIDEADLAAIGAEVGDQVPTEVLAAMMRDSEPTVRLPSGQGSRHNDLVAITGLLRRAGASDRVVETVITYIGQRLLDPPATTDREWAGIDQIIRSTQDWSPEPLRWPEIDLEGVARVGASPLDGVPTAVLARGYSRAVAAGAAAAAAAIQQALSRRKRTPRLGSPAPDADGVVSETGQRIRDVWQDAPVPDGATVPAGYILHQDGTVERIRETADRGPEVVMVCPYPVVVSSVSRDVETGQEMVTVSWRESTRGGATRWESVTVQGDLVAQARRLPEMARWGMPVTSSTARPVMDWLAALRRGSPAAYAPGRSVSMAGWVDMDGWAYVMGRDVLGGDQVEVQYPPGIDEVLDAVETAGTESDELEVWRHVAERYPGVWGVVCTGLAAPWIDVLGAEPWILHVYGPSGSGKSTALRVAAGAWGAPGGAARSLMRTWDTTARYIERLRAHSRGVPVMLDDTAQVGSRRMLDEAVYTHATGASRGRAARGGGGVQVTSRSRTVLLSTGEGPLGQSGSQGGVLARVIDVGVPVWGGLGQVEIATSQSQVLAALEVHHGALARQVAQRAVTARADPEQWRQRWAQVRQLLADDCDLSDIEGPWRATAIRWTGHLATLVVAGQVAEDICGIDPGAEVSYRVARQWLTSALEAVGREGTPADAWLDDLVTRILMRREWVYDADDVTRDPPSTGWVARMDGIAHASASVDLSGDLYIIQSQIPVVLGVGDKVTGKVPPYILAHRTDLEASGAITMRLKNYAPRIDGGRPTSWRVRLVSGQVEKQND